MKNYIAHFFTPTEHNNYRAKSLHTSVLVAYLFAALIVSISFSVGDKVLGVATDISIPRLLELVNQKRAENGLSTLSNNDQLADAARRKAEGMLAKQCWAHFCDGGLSPWTSILAAGYQYETAGENLAKDFCCSGDVVSAWMDSPSHRDNILRSSYQDVGFAIVNGTLDGGETTLVVQMFGSKNGETKPNSIIAVAKAEEIAPKKPVTIPPSKIPTATIIPATPTVFDTGSQIVSGTTKGKTTLLYTWAKQKTADLSFMIILALAIALIFDLYYAYKLDIVRLTGKNIAHLLFIGVSLIGFLVIAKGSIL